MTKQEMKKFNELLEKTEGTNMKIVYDEIEDVFCCWCENWIGSSISDTIRTDCTIEDIEHEFYTSDNICWRR